MATSKPWLLYGANGYTGEIIATLAAREGMAPLLAGRNEKKLRPLAERLGLPFITLDLDDKEKLQAYLRGAGLVLNCAGPFSRTAAQMIDACLESRCHYLDITGEVSVFEGARARSVEAQQRGVLLLPGVGFDVVPSDCLAASLKAKLPDATTLDLAFFSRGGVSRGTLKTMLEQLPQGSLSRRDGKLVKEAMGAHSVDLEIAGKRRHFTSIPWGDLSTAFHSTQIPNITTYTYTPEKSARVMRALQGPLKPLVNKATIGLAQKIVGKLVSGPSEEIRNSAKVDLWGRVKNAAGETREMRLEVPEGYRFTADAALACVRKVLEGKLSGGFYTPSTAFGADFVLSLPEVRITS